MAGVGNESLENLNLEVDHVFCCTELHGGQHAYLLREFVYVPGIGVGQPGNLPLRAAIQASANFPFAFPFRSLRTSRFSFGIWDMKRIPDGPNPDVPMKTVVDAVRIGNLPKWLTLCDGGVFDNLGVSWYLQANHTARRIERWLWELLNKTSTYQNVGTHSEKMKAEEMIQLGVLARDKMWVNPQNIIAINAGVPASWQSNPGSWVQFFGLVKSAQQIINVLYNNIQNDRAQALLDRFSTSQQGGAVVSLNEVGVEQDILDPDDEVSKRRDLFLESLPEPRQVISDLNALSKRNLKVPTTLRPLGIEQTADLLHQGYLQAMVSLHIRFQYPFLEPPKREYFTALVNGSQL